MATPSQKSADIAQRVSHVEAQMEQLVGAVKVLTNKLDNQARPQYAVMIALMALCLTLLGAFAQGPMSDLDRHDAALGKITDVVNAHLQLPGHPGVLEKVRAVDGAVTQLDETLQREMRLLDDRLQGEFRHQYESMDRRLKGVETELTGVAGNRFTRSDYEAAVPPMMKEITERIRALELGKVK